MLRLPLTTASAKLRQECSDWLLSNPPPQLPLDAPLNRFVEVSQAWQRKLAAERFVGVHWPEQYGGRGMTIVEEAVVQECLAENRSPQLINLFGLTMVGPVLIEHGTEEQKSRFLSRILSADDIWCQGFSEPGAGSDLAAVRTAAELVPGDSPSYRVTGQKIWTSFAQYASWCFMLVRTDSGLSRHKGLSYLLMPMKSEGIDVRPLRQISGDSEFNELFLDSVNVPADLLVGRQGEGWKIAISTLMYERVVLTFARHLQTEHVHQELVRCKTLRRCAMGGEPRSRYQFGMQLAEGMAIRALALKHLADYGTGTTPGPEGSLDKLGWSEHFQRSCRLLLQVGGSDAVLRGSPAADMARHQYLYSRGRTIAAGTSEIQRNIIADRLLGLRGER